MRNSTKIFESSNVSSIVLVRGKFYIYVCIYTYVYTITIQRTFENFYQDIRILKDSSIFLVRGKLYVYICIYTCIHIQYSALLRISTKILESSNVSSIVLVRGKLCICICI